MIQYGQFCPISKAMEVLGERWALLIVRELLLGADRFSMLERGLPNISPTTLNRRLHELEGCGIVSRMRDESGHGHRYALTESGRELEPVLVGLGVWGMRWARGYMADNELDAHQLMFDVQRQCRPEHMPGSGRSVIHFHFQDQESHADWWLKIDGDDVDLCLHRPGDDEDLLVETTLRCLTEIWMGDVSPSQACRKGSLKLTGLLPYEKTFSKWLGRHRLNSSAI